MNEGNEAPEGGGVGEENEAWEEEGGNVLPNPVQPKLPLRLNNWTLKNHRGL